MKHRNRTVLAGASLAALLAVPAIATAHTATITCDPADPGHYIVRPDFQQLNPVTVLGAADVTVTWSDGFKKTLPYPGGCVLPAPPPPPAAPPALEAATTPPPVVITPGGPGPEPVVVVRKTAKKKATPPKVKPRKPARITACLMAGHRVRWAHRPAHAPVVVRRGLDGLWYPVTKANGFCGPVAGSG